MQHILLLILFVVSPSLLFAQNSDTERRMQELGFVKVDLAELSKTQSAPQKACSSCPMKHATASGAKPKINHKLEIEKLKDQLPRLEQTIKDIQAANSPDPSVLIKYQTALQNTKDTIKRLEQELTSSKSASK